MPDDTPTAVEDTPQTNTPSAVRRIEFNTEIYDGGAVQIARDLYAPIMEIQIDNTNPSQVVVRFADGEHPASDELIDAFCNHALFETIQRFRSGASPR